MRTTLKSLIILCYRLYRALNNAALLGADKQKLVNDF